MTVLGLQIFKMSTANIAKIYQQLMENKISEKYIVRLVSSL